VKGNQKRKSEKKKENLKKNKNQENTDTIGKVPGPVQGRMCK